MPATATRTEEPYFGGCPSYFRACCAEASQGGTSSYSDAGWHLAMHVDSHQPDELTMSEWLGRVRNLVGHLDDGDEEAVLDWFDTYYPRCMALIPSRRRSSFAAGVRTAHEQGRIY